MSENLKIAVCQMKVGNHKDKNLVAAGQIIEKAAASGVQMVVLPEIFNSPYQASLFPAFAEVYPGPSTSFLAATAAKYHLHLIGGSIIEKDSAGHLYNTCYIYGPQGELLGRHRKIHLFDVDIAGGITFRESDTLTPGDQPTVITDASLCFGVMICFDIRFPELARSYALHGAQMLIVPAAFNTVTGPAHWETLIRARAIDNQCWVIAASPARNPESSYQAWGHSMVVNPWGHIVAEAGIDEEIIFAQIDFDLLNQIRDEMPLLRQRRPE